MTGTTSRPIRVMLVDNHVMARRGLAIFLMVFDELQLVGEAESGEAAIQLCAEVLPDVILMDMVMPDMDGATVTRSIHQQFPQVQIMVLTSFQEGELIKSALEAGVIGYLLKDVSAAQLYRAILAVASGCVTISVEAAQSLLETANQTSAPGLDLTEREREVLDLMIAGLNTTQVAGKLIVSPFTVKSHVSEILFKLSVATHAATMNLALRNHLVHCSLNLHQVMETKIS
jgi:NarL family two-component system response regulator LiaR